MTIYRRMGLALLWIVSLLTVAHWTAQAQGTPAPGVEVRFLPGAGKPGAPHGTLLANINGQWLRVTLDTTYVPDPNTLVPR